MNMISWSAQKSIYYDVEAIVFVEKIYLTGVILRAAPQWNPNSLYPKNFIIEFYSIIA